MEWLQICSLFLFSLDTGWLTGVHGSSITNTNRSWARTEKTEEENSKKKWFNEEKGYGFIRRQSWGDVFAHHSATQAARFKSLNEGDRIQFEVPRGPKRFRAPNNVVKLQTNAFVGEIPAHNRSFPSSFRIEASKVRT